jgi:hypothetical protein
MTRDDIIRLACEVGDKTTDRRGRVTFSFDEFGLERFAAIVAAAEREAIDALCNEIDPFYWGLFAEEIRARGEA